MAIQTLAKYYFTLRDLRTVQIVNWLKYALQSSNFRKVKARDFSFKPPRLRTHFIRSTRIEGDEICFLDKRLRLEDFFKPETYTTLLPLEQFTLHYMDFLLDPAFDAGRIADFTEFYERHTDLPFAFAPYPVSLRLVNLLKASHHVSYDRLTISHIEKLGQFLEKRKEFHILGNHLLKNIKALVFYHLYFQHDTKELELELRSLLDQLDEQVLPDGWHFERTPTYHLIVLEDLLDIYHVLPRSVLEGATDALEKSITGMLHVCGHWREEYPLFNDSSYGSASSLKEVQRYAKAIGFEVAAPKAEFKAFPNAGYFAYFKPEFTLWIDAGDLGPRYLPGHAHNDSLSFILYLEDGLLFGDTGACSYQDRELRDLTRSVKSHNTVKIDNLEPSEYWGNFRYARKVKLCSREVLNNGLRAEIKYRDKRHERTWEIHPRGIRISDRISDGRGTAYFHMAPGYDVRLEGDGRQAIILKAKKKVAEVHSDHSLEINESLYCPSINDIRKRPMLAAKFSRSNNTEIRMT